MSNPIQPIPELSMGGNFWTPHGATGKTTLAGGATAVFDFPGTAASGNAGFVPQQIFIANLHATNPLVVTWQGHEVAVNGAKNVRLAGKQRQIKVHSAAGGDFVMMCSDSVLPQMAFGSN